MPESSKTRGIWVRWTQARFWRNSRSSTGGRFPLRSEVRARVLCRYKFHRNLLRHRWRRVYDCRAQHHHVSTMSLTFADASANLHADNDKRSALFPRSSCDRANNKICRLVMNTPFLMIPLILVSWWCRCVLRNIIARPNRHAFVMTFHSDDDKLYIFAYLIIFFFLADRIQNYFRTILFDINWQ